MIQSMQELAARLLAARKAVGLTQEELASGVGLDRTSISKIEKGTRQVDSLELARIAEMLERPVTWFLESRPPAAISRREEREDGEQEADVLLETIASDVEQLIERQLLVPQDRRRLPGEVDDLAAAEELAAAARTWVNRPGGPIRDDLVDVVEPLGLYTFVLTFPRDRLEGSYVALSRGGVALVQGASEVGRRRFTIAHELGHHVLQDAYSSEWITSASPSDRERLINAFAVHFLLPRASVQSRWQELEGHVDRWNAAVHLAAEYGVSWSALCGHLKNLGLVDELGRQELDRRVPRSADFLERGLRISAEPRAPTIPSGYSAAVIKGLRRQKLARARALELLHGTVIPADLDDDSAAIPLEAMSAELGPLE